MTQSERENLVRGYLGKTVTVTVDRPIGYVHRKGEKVLTYPVNYGYIAGVLGGDGEELDVYVLGIDRPVAECEVRVIGIVFRADDVEDKLIAAPQGNRYRAEEATEAIRFAEKYYHSRVEICPDLLTE